MINLVGEEINQRLTAEAKTQIHDSRIRATKNLVDGMTSAANGPRNLISQSAVGYYGDRGEAMIDESTRPGRRVPRRRSRSNGRTPPARPRAPGSGSRSSAAG